MKIVNKAIGFAALALLMIPAASADTWDKKTNVTFRQPVEFPGGTVLAPGTYVMKLLNSATNRNIVQVYNQDQDKMFAMVMAIPAQRMEPADRTIITFYETPQNEPALIRTWFYPGDTAGQEFPYPKGRVRYVNASAPTTSTTVAIATPIPAPVEVASPRPLAQAAPLAQFVDEPKPVDTNVAINSEESRTPAEEPVLLAQATPQPANPQAPRADAAVGDATTPVDQLPSTASNAPYWAAGSIVLLAGAFLMGMTRRVCG